MNDPMKELESQLGNPIGVQELELRKQLGDDRYVALIKREDRFTAAHSAYVEAKGRFWGALAFALSAGAVLGMSWSIWTWVR